MTFDRDNRIGEESPQSEVLASTYAILALPRPSQTHALVIWPGFERKHCFRYGAELWAQGQADVLLLAGQNPEESPDNLHLDESEFRKKFGIPDDSRFYSQGEAFHTGMQAEWLTKMVNEHNLLDVALVAPAFHMTRAYMTIVASMKKANTGHVPIYPFPTAMDLGEIIPIPDANQWRFAQKEAKRILAYQIKGDVCSFEAPRAHISTTWAKWNTGI